MVTIFTVRTVVSVTVPWKNVFYGCLVENKVLLSFVCRGLRQNDQSRRFEWASLASVCSRWNYRLRIYLLTERLQI